MTDGRGTAAPSSASAPNFRYHGWRISASLSVTTLLSYGVLFYTFGVVTKPMEAEFDWTRFQTSVAFSIATLVNGLTSVAAGRIVDRHGGRWLGGVATIAGAALLFAWAEVTTLPQFYIVFALLGAVWSCVFYEVAFAVIATWFRRDRARATFLITMVAGFASTVFYPLTTYLVEGQGWRAALRLLAVGFLVACLPLHLGVVRERPQRSGLTVDGIDASGTEPETSVAAVDARRTGQFWRLAIAFGMARYLASAASGHLVPLLQEAGKSPATAAAIAGTIGPLQVLGRIFFLPLSKRFSLRILSTLTFCVFVVGFLALFAKQSGVFLFVFVVLYGAANGASTLNRASMTAEQFGPAAYGQISGSMAMVGSLMASLASISAGQLRTMTGDYRTLLALIAAMSAGGAVLLWGVHPPDSSATD